MGESWEAKSLNQFAYSLLHFRGAPMKNHFRLGPTDLLTAYTSVVDSGCAMFFCEYSRCSIIREARITGLCVTEIGYFLAFPSRYVRYFDSGHN